MIRRPHRPAAVVAGVLALALSACTASDGNQAASSTLGETSSQTTAAPPTTVVTTEAPTTAVPSTPAPTAPSTTSTTVVRSATTLVPPPGPLLGVAVPEGRAETIREIEADAGETFHLIRIFLRWEDELASSDIAELQAEGRAIHLSVRPLRDDGTPIPWAEIASTTEDSVLFEEMVAWADEIVALGPDTRFTFNHEPETSESTPNGDALDYRAAWRRMVTLIRSRGGDDIDMVWTVGAGILSNAEGRDFYPGDDVVDVVGADLYNWFTCQGTDRDWVSFNDLIGPAVDFAAERGKPLSLPEFASAADPDDVTRRAGWMDAAVDVMAEWDPAERQGVALDFVAWFDVTAPGGTNPDCRWSHRTDEPTTQAFNRMMRDLVGAQQAGVVD